MNRPGVAARIASLLLLPLLLGAKARVPEPQRGMPLTQAQAKLFYQRSVDGKRLAEQKRFDASAEEFKKALLIRPDHADTYTNLANVYYYGGKSAKAWDCYALSLKLDPKQAEMRKWLQSQKAPFHTFGPADGAAFLKWEASPGAKGYLVYRKRGPGLPDLKLTAAPLPLPEFVARGITPGERGVFSLTQIRDEGGKPLEKPLGDMAGCAVLLSLYETKKR